MAVAVGRVHFDVRTWTRVRLLLGLPSRVMARRYGCTSTVRGLDTGRWYLTTTVAEFARLLADVRGVGRRAVR
ncbi:hypothetical protein ACFVZ5_30840 [Streptomyces sp. NPDC059570]